MSLLHNNTANTVKLLSSGLKRISQTIKFTAEISETLVNFLDVTVFNDEHGNILTNLYTKSTDYHLYLHYGSFHPKKVKVQGMPQSQTAALPRHQEEEETDKTKQEQIKQTYKKH